MCGIATNTKPKKAIEDTFSAKFKADWQPKYAIKAFANSTLPIITNTNAADIIMSNWGLIPSFITTQKEASIFKTKTINARSETIFEKPSFKNNIVNNRCLILLDGFVEYQHNGNHKQAYYVQVQQGALFAMAGIYNYWHNPDTQLNEITCSIVTVAANQLMCKIHNSKERMPLILKHADQDNWLNAASVQDVTQLFYQYDTQLMSAYPIHNNIGKQHADLTSSDILNPIQIITQGNLF
jgi:putative SOS response-associated peptidase YedK